MTSQVLFLSMQHSWKLWANRSTSGVQRCSFTVTSPGRLSTFIVWNPCRDAGELSELPVENSIKTTVEKMSQKSWSKWINSQFKKRKKNPQANTKRHFDRIHSKQPRLIVCIRGKVGQAFSSQNTRSRFTVTSVNSVSNFSMLLEKDRKTGSSPTNENLVIHVTEMTFCTHSRWALSKTLFCFAFSFRMELKMWRNTDGSRRLTGMRFLWGNWRWVSSPKGFPKNLCFLGKKRVQFSPRVGG